MRKLGEGATADIYDSEGIILKVVPFAGFKDYNGFP